MATSSVRNRTQIVKVATPRGTVEVARQEMRGIEPRRGWEWFWVARRAGTHNWISSPDVRDAIRRATLLPARRPPKWLAVAAADAEHQIADAAGSDGADSDG
jgi:hypothetical protein